MTVDAGAAGRLTVGIDARKIRDYGIGRYLEGLLGGFARRGGDDAFVLFLSEPSLAELPGELPALLDPARFRPVACRAPLYSLREILAFRGVAARHGLDLLHVPHYLRVLGPGCPVAVTIHDPIHLLWPPSRLAGLYARLMMGWAARSAALRLTGTRAARDDLARLLGTAPDRWEVTPYAVGPEFAPPAPEAVAAFRKRRGLPEAFILCVASHRPHKNLAAAAAAFRAAALPDAALIVPARDAAAARRLEPLLAGTTGAPLLSPVPDEELPLLYAAARLVLVPSRYEGFGLPGLEAMACGAPVLASGIPAHREVLGEAAWIAASPEPADLTAGLRELWRDDAQRRRLAAGGPAHAARFTWDATAAATLTLYRDTVRDV